MSPFAPDEDTRIRFASRWICRRSWVSTGRSGVIRRTIR